HMPPLPAERRTPASLRPSSSSCLPDRIARTIRVRALRHCHATPLVIESRRRRWVGARATRPGARCCRRAGRVDWGSGRAGPAGMSHRHRRSLSVLPLLLAALALSPADSSVVYRGSAGELNVVVPREADPGVRIDGRLDEEVWQRAAVLTGFTL